MKDRRLSIALQAAILVSLLLAAMASAPMRDTEPRAIAPLAGAASEQAD